MRNTNLHVIHCSANKISDSVTAEDLKRYHIKQRKFRDIGYHFVVELDGTIIKGRPIEQTGAHAQGYNDISIGTCYIGGLDDNGRPADTRTPEQKVALKSIDKMLRILGYITETVGHRDLSVDLNGDGVISPGEWMKSCPCFDVKTEL